MGKLGHRRSTLAQVCTRRKLLLGAALPLLALSACGDESNERHFAGDPRTVQPDGNATEPGTGTGPAEASPTAVATVMSAGDLLDPRGTQAIAVVPLRHDLVAIDSESGSGTTIWQNPERSIWAAKADPASEFAAILTSERNAAADWTVEFVPIAGGEAVSVRVGEGSGGDGHRPDSVAGGRGGLDWLPDSSSIALSLPTGGLMQVYRDGSKVRLAKASAAKRPAEVAVTVDGSAIAYIEQPSGSEGTGIYAGSLRAKPIDPIVVLPADRSGNRYARQVGWIGASDRIATILEREELGRPQGDLFVIDTQSKVPHLAWTSPAGRDIASVESFAVSDDGLVTAFVTNPTSSGATKPSSVWVKQTDGPAIERFDLPVQLSDSRLSYAPNGLLVSGITGRTDEEDGFAAAFLLEPNGVVSLVYQQVPAATPVASPQGSPVASPLASPQASPVGSPSPVSSPT